MSSVKTIWQKCDAGKAKVFEYDSLSRKPMYIHDLNLLERLQTTMSANPGKVTARYLPI